MRAVVLEARPWRRGSSRTTFCGLGLKRSGLGFEGSELDLGLEAGAPALGGQGGRAPTLAKNLGGLCPPWTH